jgi:predicted transcriptional regulator
MTYQPGGIMTNRSKPKPWGAILALAALFVLLVYSSWYTTYRGSASPVFDGGQEAALQNATQVATETPAPTATATPNRLLETASAYNVVEAQARADGAQLQNTIIAAQATDGAKYTADAVEIQVQRTARAVETEQVRAAEAISITNGIMLAQATATVEAMTTAANLEIGGKVTLYAVIFIAALFGGAFLAYIAITTWRQAGQPVAAVMAEYTPPEPSRLEVATGSQLRYPLAGSEITVDELRIISNARNGRQITFRAIEAGGITSERWEVIRDELVDAGFLITSGSERIRVFTTDEGEGLLKMYSTPSPSAESTQ